MNTVNKLAILYYLQLFLPRASFAKHGNRSSLPVCLSVYLS